MPTSRRQSIIDAIKGRLQAIRIAGGYETDLGLQVHVWRDTATSPFTPEELTPGALNLRDPKRQTEQQLVDHHHHTLTINIELAVAGGTEAQTVRKMLADLDKAIGVDRKWGGLAFDTDPGDDQILVAQNGATITGASYHFTVLFRTRSFDPYTP